MKGAKGAKGARGAKDAKGAEGARGVKGAARRSVAGRAPAKEIDAIRKQIARVAGGTPPRWNADPEDVRRSVMKLVLTLVELIRQLLERQAIRRMDANTLTADEIESVGLALMRLQETIEDLAKQFDIAPEELNLDLGPVGTLM